MALVVTGRFNKMIAREIGFRDITANVNVMREMAAVLAHLALMVERLKLDTALAHGVHRRPVPA
jgi:FixJ family two-component response regulator